MKRIQSEVVNARSTVERPRSLATFHMPSSCKICMTSSSWSKACLGVQRNWLLADRVLAFVVLTVVLKVWTILTTAGQQLWSWRALVLRAGSSRSMKSESKPSDRTLGSTRRFFFSSADSGCTSTGAGSALFTSTILSSALRATFASSRSALLSLEKMVGPTPAGFRYLSVGAAVATGSRMVARILASRHHRAKSFSGGWSVRYTSLSSYT